MIAVSSGDLLPGDTITQTSMLGYVHPILVLSSAVRIDTRVYRCHVMFWTGKTEAMVFMVDELITVSRRCRGEDKP